MIPLYTKKMMIVTMVNYFEFRAHTMLVLGLSRTETKTLINNQNCLLLDQDNRKYRHTGYNFQEESRKNILSLSLFSFWINVQEEYILPAFLLKVVAVMLVFPVVLIDQEPILIIAQSFGFSSVQPQTSPSGVK